MISGSIILLWVFGGILSNSLALLADAGHLATDALSLALALFAMRLARRPHTVESSYGYHRAEALAALINGAMLFLIAGYVFYEGYGRFLHPPGVNGQILLPVAAVGLAGNFVMVLLLRKGSDVSINIKAAFLHVLGDTFATIGVIVGGVVMVLYGLSVVDVLVASLIGILILRGAYKIVRGSLRIIMEQTPKDVRLTELTSEMMKVDGVKSVHELHVWSLTSGMNMMSCHVDVDEHHRDHEVLEALKNVAEKSNITHTTIQIEHHEDHEGFVNIGVRNESNADRPRQK
ncbi:MAG: cation diffusion facilitator family transporter [Nitrososphaerales archaeon]|nr:cation diffusion facilitator family transporter [Nitrososphaerales archaeon]